MQQLLRERHLIAERGEDPHQSGPSGISDRSSPSISPCIAMAIKSGKHKVSGLSAQNVHHSASWFEKRRIERQKAVSRKVAYDTERLEGPDQSSLEGTVSEPTATPDFFYLYPSDITMKSPLLRKPDSAPDSDVSMSPAMVPRVSFFARTPIPHATTLVRNPFCWCKPTVKVL